MQRRSFIKKSSAVLLPALLGGFNIRAFGRGSFFDHFLQQVDPASDRVLVIVQLFGGNDGLNTLVPLASYDGYYKARKNLALPEKKLLDIPGHSSLGFHPVLTGFRDLYAEGKLAMIQSVGYPSPNFSHFRSSDIWLSASDANQAISTGWSGRYLHHLYPQYPAGFPNAAMPDPLAVQVGTATSFMFQGIQSPMAINVANTRQVYNLTNGFRDTSPATKAGSELDFVRLVAEQSQVYSQVIKKVADRVPQQSSYPDGNELANQLKIVAQLIKGGLRTKMYLVSFDGFDTHAQQVNGGDTTTGRHADLLRTVNDAISAFQKDLAFLGIEERVMGMTFSEFGRRIASNDSLGTDHGTAAPLFVFGKQVKGGVYGKDPVVPGIVTPEDNLPMQTDFRSVYATMLRNWMGLPSEMVDQVLLQRFETLDLVLPA